MPLLFPSFDFRRVRERQIQAIAARHAVAQRFALRDGLCREWRPLGCELVGDCRGDWPLRVDRAGDFPRPGGEIIQNIGLLPLPERVVELRVAAVLGPDLRVELASTSKLPGDDGLWLELLPAPTQHDRRRLIL